MVPISRSYSVSRSLGLSGSRAERRIKKHIKPIMENPTTQLDATRWNEVSDTTFDYESDYILKAVLIVV
jgi:hypothetical protein